MNQDEQLYKEIYPVKYFRDYLQHNIRPDGRNLLGSRPLQLNVNSITTADGSATVKLGNTVVVCGIKAEIATPTVTEPDQGYFVPNVEYTPLCSPKYRPGAPPEDAQVCSRTLFDILTNSNCLDVKDLKIISEKFVWTLYCDVVVLNDDGCVLDAAVIAVVAALKNTKLPKIDYDLSTEQASADEKTKIPLKVSSLPVATSFMIFDDKVIADPTAEEEKLSAACITVAICNSELSFLYKPGGEPVEPEMLEKCIKQAKSREKLVLELLTKVLNQKT
ncbi:exosome complex component RRP43-like [Culicoides brevitarsis]|uniref:exosome complex component RRP43-like n=1 Tax=Culicoides brevitarsis TaxID=469753 RepID=UPI00307C1E32